MKKWTILGIVFIASAILIFTWAKTNPDYKASQQVIENWFSAMKAGNVELADTYLAPDFISLHTDGKTRNKAQELDLIKNLNMKSYHLSQFKFSESGNIVIVTFKDQGSEKIDFHAISSKPAGRMAILQKIEDKWLIVAYANMDTLS